MFAGFGACTKQYFIGWTECYLTISLRLHVDACDASDNMSARDRSLFVFSYASLLAPRRTRRHSVGVKRTSGVALSAGQQPWTLIPVICWLPESSNKPHQVKARFSVSSRQAITPAPPTGSLWSSVLVSVRVVKMRSAMALASRWLPSVVGLDDSVSSFGFCVALGACVRSACWHG